MISSDVRDILEIESSGGKDITAKEKKRLKRSFEPIKRPVGVNREVWGLIRTDDMRDQPPLIPSDEPKLYKQPKAKFRYGVRKWKWIEFKNPARTDNALFSHWRCVTDEIKEYPFAKLNKKINLPTYTDLEYNQYLIDDNWNKLETDYLFSLCAKYDLRFFVIHDRWDVVGYKARSIDEIKDRYYKVVGTLEKLRTSTNGDDTATTTPNSSTQQQQPQKEVFVFDLEHEQKRREQLDKLFKRTKEQIEEEQYLLEELKKIEIRKKERERKSQDVNKLLTAAVDLEPITVQQQPISNGGVSLNKVNLNNSTIAGRRTKQRKSSIQQQSSTDLNNSSTSRSPTASTNNNGLSTQNNQALDLSKDKSINKKSLIFKASVESGGIKFPDNKTAGVSLRSYKMKLPPSVGSKKTKAIETLLEQFQIDSRPMARDAVCEQFNDLRSDMVLLYELNQALLNCDFELQTLRHRYDGINPGKSIEMASLETSASSNTSQNLIETPQKRISDVFEISVTPTVPLERRRKAALNQSNILKKLRGRSTT